ncbi:hypothetical protein LMH73_003645 [Vibrio splendidus]|nr:hypothetical protein [Vibrio splendidus]MCC4883250.1 hypothetical protein [Vibrio splendidus]
MKNINNKKLTVLGLAIGAMLTISAPVKAGDSSSSNNKIPTRASVCKSSSKDKIEKYIEKQESSCESQYKIDTTNKAEKSDYWSDSEDTKCDLGFEFPSLPGFSIDLSKLNACEIMQAVTEEVVDEVNETTQGAIDNITENVTGDKDGIDMDIDPNDTIIDELESEGIIE